jgi:Na+/melibiose symporter-like transporter
MALSNIGNEPRREITEQLIGFAAILGFLALDYGVTRWLGATKPYYIVMIMMMVGVIGVFVVGVVTIFAHSVGELVCEGLSALGADPRPRQRYRRCPSQTIPFTRPE